MAANETSGITYSRDEQRADSDHVPSAQPMFAPARAPSEV